LQTLVTISLTAATTAMGFSAYKAKRARNMLSAGIGKRVVI